MKPKQVEKKKQKAANGKGPDAAAGVQAGGKVNKAASAKLAAAAGLKKKKKKLLNEFEGQQQRQEQQQEQQQPPQPQQPQQNKKQKMKKQKTDGVSQNRKRQLPSDQTAAAAAPSAAAQAAGKKRQKLTETEPKSTENNTREKEYLTDTEPVKDPIVRAEIKNYVEQRVLSTVRLRPLPNRLRLAQIVELAPEAAAVRLPWNNVNGRNKGLAFIEFHSPQAAQQAAKKLDGSKSLGFKLGASIRDDTQLVDADDYNCSRIVVSSLHPMTTAQELKDLVKTVTRVDFLSGSKSLRKHTPAVAFLTFANERDALAAARQFQGEVIRNRKTSWMFQKRVERLSDKEDRAELVVFGVSKKVTDAELLKAFPNCQKMDVRHEKGMAIVSYASEPDCRLDFDACKGGVVRVGKAKLRVFYGHKNYKPIDTRRREAAVKAAAAAADADADAVEANSAPRPKPRPPRVDSSLLNKSQLIVKDFNPDITDSAFTEFVSGVTRVFFTGNRRLAFLHFATEAAAAEAKEKLATQPLNGDKLKVMYAMDKPDKVKAPAANNRRDNNKFNNKKGKVAMPARPDKPKQFSGRGKAQPTTAASS